MSMRSAEARLARKTLTGELLTCVWRATEARISALPTTPSTKVSEYTAREGPWTQNSIGNGNLHYRVTRQFEC